MLPWIPQPYAFLTAFGDTQIKLVNQLLLRHEIAISTKYAFSVTWCIDISSQASRKLELAVERHKTKRTETQGNEETATNINIE